MSTGSIGVQIDLVAEREWQSVEELIEILEEVIAEYNDDPHQGH
jgi:CRISPR/Cas system CSM-associated protein Csm2 small subunit